MRIACFIFNNTFTNVNIAHRRVSIDQTRRLPSKQRLRCYEERLCRSVVDIVVYWTPFATAVVCTILVHNLNDDTVYKRRTRVSLDFEFFFFSISAACRSINNVCLAVLNKYRVNKKQKKNLSLTT